ncbi:hypothetical protein G7046_g6660 [Stylonectria norvegica]|nr:hypothetical protein G7046_g6660 [Stylonectria norvegica]
MYRNRNRHARPPLSRSPSSRLLCSALHLQLPSNNSLVTISVTVAVVSPIAHRHQLLLVLRGATFAVLSASPLLHCLEVRADLPLLKIIQAPETCGRPSEELSFRPEDREAARPLSEVSSKGWYELPLGNGRDNFWKTAVPVRHSLLTARCSLPLPLPLPNPHSPSSLSRLAPTCHIALLSPVFHFGSWRTDTSVNQAFGPFCPPYFASSRHVSCFKTSQQLETNIAASSFTSTAINFLTSLAIPNLAANDHESIGTWPATHTSHSTFPFSLCPTAPPIRRLDDWAQAELTATSFDKAPSRPCIVTRHITRRQPSS